MKVERINHHINRFIEYLESTEEFPFLYKYDSLRNFKEHWDIEALDFHSMFDRSFKGRISNRLWGGSRQSAKSVMLDFIAADKEFVRSMFRDLLDEKKDLNMRVNRFVFHCDQLIDRVYHHHKHVKDHKHNLKIISLYLCFVYPGEYTVLEYDPLKNFLNAVELNNMPAHFEADRMTKLARGIFKQMLSNDKLLSIYKEKITENLVPDFNMLAVHDLYVYISGT